MSSSWPIRRGLPVTISVPLVVVVLMIFVGIGGSQLVLSRLAATQERQLRDLASAYLDGLEAALIDPVLRQDSWEVFDVLDRARESYAGVKPLVTTVTDADGTVLASSEPRGAPIGTKLIGETIAPEPVEVVLQEAQHRALLDRNLTVEGRTIGAIHSTLDISPLLAERSDVLWYLVLSNAVLTFVFAALGWFTVRRMITPMRVLLEHISASTDGSVEPIREDQIGRQGPEWSRLFRRFNVMAAAVTERETLLSRVADEERLASLGKLASSVAHEINNPLGGILNAVDTIRVHGDDARVRTSAIDLVDRGLRGMRDVVRSILVSYREDRESRDLTPADLDDLLVLVRPEIRRKQLSLSWSNDLTSRTPVKAFGVRQIVLNLLLNACRATPSGGTLGLAARQREGALEIEVSDQGPGLPAHIGEYLVGEQQAASRLASSGLGLWVTKRIISELKGAVRVRVPPVGGTQITVLIPLARESVIEREVEHVA